MTRPPLRFVSALSLLLLLAGCSSRPDLPNFTASGYLADRGTVRIWRKDTQPDTRRILTIFTPFSAAGEETTDYLWQAEKLVSIERQSSGKHPASVTLRFDRNGKMNFMQRQLEGRREALSDDAIALYQFDAGRMLKISDDLLAGRVLLKQGHWSPSGVITTCQGNQSQPEFDRYALSKIAHLQQGSDKPVSLAWLEAPEGAQFLLVERKDLCATEPKEEGF